MMLDVDGKSGKKNGEKEICEEGRGPWGLGGDRRLASGCHLYVSALVRLSVKIKRRTHRPTDRTGQDRTRQGGQTGQNGMA